MNLKAMLVWLLSFVMHSNASMYVSEINSLQLSNDLKKQIYAAYQALDKISDSSTQALPQNRSKIDVLYSLPHFKLMSALLTPQILSPLQNEPLSEICQNYAQYHLKKAFDRLDSIVHFDQKNSLSDVTFSGDACDFGIIVNFYNNTETQFKIMQRSLVSDKTIQIGQLDSGLNGLNLHLASLKNPIDLKSGKQSTDQAVDCFDFIEIGSNSPITFSVYLMQGSAFLNFLNTLYRDSVSKSKNIFEMNGSPSSPQYLVDEKAWYMVLVQNPTLKNQSSRNINQRIQIINLSSLKNPSMISMSLSTESLNISNLSKNAATEIIYQPSIKVAQTVACQNGQSINVPIVILPTFLSKILPLRAHWNLLYTTILANVTEYKLFGPGSCGNMYQYFKGLGAFDNKNRYIFFVDLYNNYTPGYTIYNAGWLMSSAVYETSLKNCSDIAQIYVAQDPYCHPIVNEDLYFYINFMLECVPQIPAVSDEQVFNQAGFNQAYNNLLHKVCYVMQNGLLEDIKKGIFGQITQTKDGVYSLQWTDKKNKIIASQMIYAHAPLSDIQIAFINAHGDWTGSSLPANLLPQTIGQAMQFKVTYEYSPVNNKHILLTDRVSDLDKQEVFLPMYFSMYPLKNLYIDAYKTFNVLPFTRCMIIDQETQPICLQALTKKDWQLGIYMIVSVDNNEKINSKQPGVLTVKFYRYDKSFIGSINISGKVNSVGPAGIFEPVSAYNVYFGDNVLLADTYLTTGVLLKYVGL